MRIYRMGQWVALEIADRIFLFDKNGRQDDKSGAPMTLGWARQAGVWDELFAFPDDPTEPELADDVAAYAGLFQADIINRMENAPPEEERWTRKPGLYYGRLK